MARKRALSVKEVEALRDDGMHSDVLPVLSPSIG